MVVLWTGSCETLALAHSLTHSLTYLLTISQQLRRILREVKVTLDDQAEALNVRIRKLRETQRWLREREAKLDNADAAVQEAASDALVTEGGDGIEVDESGLRTGVNDSVDVFDQSIADVDVSVDVSATLNSTFTALDADLSLMLDSSGGGADKQFFEWPTRLLSSGAPQLFDQLLRGRRRVSRSMGLDADTVAQAAARAAVAAIRAHDDKMQQRQRHRRHRHYQHSAKKASRAAKHAQVPPIPIYPYGMQMPGFGMMGMVPPGMQMPMPVPVVQQGRGQGQEAGQARGRRQSGGSSASDEGNMPGSSSSSTGDEVESDLETIGSMGVGAHDVEDDGKGRCFVSFRHCPWAFRT